MSLPQHFVGSNWELRGREFLPTDVNTKFPPDLQTYSPPGIGGKSAVKNWFFARSAPASFPCLPRRCIDAASRMSRFIQIRSSITFIYLRLSVIHNHLPRNTRRRPHHPSCPIAFFSFCAWARTWMKNSYYPNHPFFGICTWTPIVYIHKYIHPLSTYWHTYSPSFAVFFGDKSLGKSWKFVFFLCKFNYFC